MKLLARLSKLLTREEKNVISSGCKSWAAFAKNAANLRIDRRPGHKITVSPSVRDAKGAFFPVAEREQHLESPTEEQLGALVAAELKR